MPLIPQSLFGRLFAATLLVSLVTVTIVALLIASERRDLAFLGSAWNTTKVIADTSETLATLGGLERRAALENLREHPLVLDDLRGRRPLPTPEELAATQKSFTLQLRRQLGPDYGVEVERASLANRDVIRIEGTRWGAALRAAGAAADAANSEIADAPGARRPPTLREFEEDTRGAGAPSPQQHGGAPPPEQHGDTPPPRPRGMGGGPANARLRSLLLAWRYDVTVTFPDGQRVMFRALAPLPPPPLPRAIFVEIAALTAALGVALFIMTRTITRPLRELASAADAMGRGAYPAPITENGARELRQATRAFNTMQERLHRYLESRTRVLAAMSHDLRTTLTRLRLRAETIDDDDLRTRFSADLDEMSQMVQGALALFRDLNDAEPFAQVDVNALLATLRAEFAELDADVTVAGRANGPLSAKPLALKRCLTNLLHNAIKYGTSATVQVSDDEAMVIRIRDTGPGIPEESLEQVFEPFFRVEGSRNRDTGGAGLGLSIARDIAQAHGGSIVLSNLAGGGLEATVTLPRAAPSL